METRNLGRSGLQVSLVGLGCNNFGMRIDLARSREVIDRAIERGITLFDTADSYGDKGGSERILGEVLGPRRKEIVLATKFGSVMDDRGVLKGGSRRYVMRAVEASLQRLRTDWIDLYQLHKPDPATPIEETLRALDDLVHQGKVRYLGCSNLAAWSVADAAWTAKHFGLAPFVCAQDEYSLLARDHERDLLPALQAYGMGLLPYYPLASGLLTGKYRRGQPLPEGSRLATSATWAERFLTARNWDVVEALERFARERGRALVDLAFAWLASRKPVASIIAGATSPQQVDVNVGAAEWQLSQDDLACVDRILAS
ncbi:MAG TPA: aldo/keto reductase [Casimicrobiaceae bacterium]|nr:aldo/keto reductase [Casimicrobiaceae bacterium]